MAPKKAVKPLAEAPPDPDSSEDSSSTEIEEEDEQQQPQVQPQNDEVSSSSDGSSDEETHIHPKKQDASEEEEDDDEGEEEDGEEEKQQSPVVQKPQNLMTSPSRSASKPRPKPKPVVGPTAEKEKRPLEEKEKENRALSKKPRKEKEDKKLKEEEEVLLKKQSSALFQRLFSDEDEIVILKGLIDYKLEKGVDPMNDLDDFYGFIKKSLECNCDKKQIADKIRRLKKRFYNEKKKLTTPHENQIFELSKKIWENVHSVADEANGNGSNVVVGLVVDNSNAAAGGKSSSKTPRVVKSKKSVGNGVVEEKMKVEDEMEVDGVKNWKLVECDVKDLMEAASKERLRKKAFKLMGATARAELAEMWDKVTMAQMEVDQMRFEVSKEENKRIVAALKSD